MNGRIVAFAQSLFVLTLFAAPSFAADDETLKKDLTAVIALQGLPCGEVVNVIVQAESDFAVTCKDAVSKVGNYARRDHHRRVHPD
jgi:hypothetical protein